MPIITVHLLSIPTQSEAMQKALSVLTSCTLESSSSFFCWLQLSVVVWVRRRLITLPLSNEPIIHIHAWGGDVTGGCHTKKQCVCPWQLNVKCDALYGWMSYTLRNQFMFTIFFSTFQITVIRYTRVRALHLLYLVVKSDHFEGNIITSANCIINKPIPWCQFALLLFCSG